MAYIYFQVFENKTIDEVLEFYQHNFSFNTLFNLFIAFLLMFVNWGLEAQKWRLILKESYQISFFMSMKAVFSGNSTGILTPNRLGAFVGRILHLPNGYKAEGTLTTWIGNAAQLIATLIFGTIAAFIFSHNEYYLWNLSNEIPLAKFSFFVASLLLSIGALVVYFLSGKLLIWISKFSFFNRFLDKLEKINSFSTKQLILYLFLSVLRYSVFILQFYFLFKAFDVFIPLDETLVYVGVLYILISFVPTFLGKLGVRESVLLILLSHLPYNELQIISASVSLWLINTIFPALIGAFLILNIKENQ